MARHRKRQLRRAAAAARLLREQMTEQRLLPADCSWMDARTCYLRASYYVEHAPLLQKNWERVRQYYAHAAAAGYGWALYALGEMYQSGQGGSKDEAKALKCFEQAACQNVGGALLNLGLYFRSQGDSSKAQDFMRQALQRLMREAETGNSDACCNLGFMYANGLGVEVDGIRALAFLKRAVAQGMATAESNLGCLLLDGCKNVPKDTRRARYFLLRAALKGQMTAQNNLAYCYQLGEGGDVDYHKAHYWYHLAAAQGNHIASKNLGDMYHHAQGCFFDYDQARACYLKSALKGNPTALYNLAWIYLKPGRKVPKRPLPACQLLLKGIADPACLNELKRPATWSQSSPSRMARGLTLLKQRQYETALNVLEPLLNWRQLSTCALTVPAPDRAAVSVVSDNLITADTAESEYLLPEQCAQILQWRMLPELKQQLPALNAELHRLYTRATASAHSTSPGRMLFRWCALTAMAGSREAAELLALLYLSGQFVTRDLSRAHYCLTALRVQTPQANTPSSPASTQAARTGTPVPEDDTHVPQADTPDPFGFNALLRHLKTLQPDLMAASEIAVDLSSESRSAHSILQGLKMLLEVAPPAPESGQTTGVSALKPNSLPQVAVPPALSGLIRGCRELKLGHIPAAVKILAEAATNHKSMHQCQGQSMAAALPRLLALQLISLRTTTLADKESRIWLKQGCRLHLVTSLNIMGTLYQNLGAFDKADYWLRQAADYGNGNAMLALGDNLVMTGELFQPQPWPQPLAQVQRQSHRLQLSLLDMEPAGAAAIAASGSPVSCQAAALLSAQARLNLKEPGVPDKQEPQDYWNDDSWEMQALNWYLTSARLGADSHEGYLRAGLLILAAVTPIDSEQLILARFYLHKALEHQVPAATFYYKLLQLKDKGLTDQHLD